MEENYNLSSILPGVCFPFDIVRKKEFLEWIRTPESTIWLLVHSCVVRAQMKSHKLGKYIYKKYYLNKHAVAWITQTEMAKRLGYKDKSFISRQLKKLVEKGIIVEFEDSFNKKRLKLYETASVLDVLGQQEQVHLYTYFRKKFAENTLAKFK